MPGKRKRSSVVASSSNRSDKKQTAGKGSLEETKEDDKKTATAPSLSPLDPTIEAVPRLIVLGGQQTVVSVNGSVEVGGRTWTVQQANPSKLVLICDRLEDEDVKFSAAKDAAKQEVSQRRQDIQHLEEDKMGVLSRMEDENEDADALATELGTTPLWLLFVRHQNLTNNPHKPPSPL